MWQSLSASLLPQRLHADGQALKKFRVAIHSDFYRLVSTTIASVVSRLHKEA